MYRKKKLIKFRRPAWCTGHRWVANRQLHSEWPTSSDGHRARQTASHHELLIRFRRINSAPSCQHDCCEALHVGPCMRCAHACSGRNAWMRMHACTRALAQRFGMHVQHARITPMIALCIGRGYWSNSFSLKIYRMKIVSNTKLNRNPNSDITCNPNLNPKL